MKKTTIFLVIATILLTLLAGCGEKPEMNTPSVPDTIPATESIAQTEKVTEPPTEPTVDPMEIAKSAYQCLGMAAGLMDCFGADICIAWETGIYDAEELSEDGIGCLMKKISLTEDELRDGAANLAYSHTGQSWDNIPDEQWEELRQQANQGFAEAYQEDAMFDHCINVVLRSYLEAGRTDLCTEVCAQIKEIIRELERTDPNNAYCQLLKEYYEVIFTYLTWCKDPTGSYNDASALITAYREDCKIYSSKMDFDLGE